MEFVFLSKDFYNQYDRKNHPEILTKNDRPYCMLKVQIGENTFAIPFRSNIRNHNNAFMTNKKDNCGIDYSKAVIINDLKYIDADGTPYIRPEEFRAIKGQDHKVKLGMEKFIKQYKKAYQNRTITRNKLLCKFSTLQYFHKEIGLK